MNASELAYCGLINLGHRLLKQIGVDVTQNAFARSYLERKLHEHHAEITKFVNVIVADPPHSVDAASQMVKESLNGIIDKFADELNEKIGVRPISKDSATSKLIDSALNQE